MLNQTMRLQKPKMFVKNRKYVKKTTNSISKKAEKNG